MSTAAAQTTPAWVPTLVSALLTVGATWTTIQTQVPEIVAQQVHGQLMEHRDELRAGADSLWAATEATIMARVDSATAHAADTVLIRLGYLQEHMGTRTTYTAPHIIVQRDTAMARRVDLALALIATELAQLQERLDQQQPPISRNKRGRD